jgi:hypothetical protein
VVPRADICLWAAALLAAAKGPKSPRSPPVASGSPGRTRELRVAGRRSGCVYAVAAGPRRGGWDGDATSAPIERFAAAVMLIAKSHAGRPQSEILAALLAAAQEADVDASASDLSHLAEQLSRVGGAAH